VVNFNKTTTKKLVNLRGEMAKRKMYWFYNPPKAPKPKVPELMKIEVKKVGDELIVSVLKPNA
jgi:hypothetical protein